MSPVQIWVEPRSSSTSYKDSPLRGNFCFTIALLFWRRLNRLLGPIRAISHLGAHSIRFLRFALLSDHHHRPPRQKSCPVFAFDPAMISRSHACLKGCDAVLPGLSRCKLRRHCGSLVRSQRSNHWPFGFHSRLSIPAQPPSDTTSRLLHSLAELPRRCSSIRQARFVLVAAPAQPPSDTTSRLLQSLGELHCLFRS